VSQVVEEAVSQSFTHVCAGDKTGDVEEFDRDGASAIDAGAIVWFTSLCRSHAGAGAIDLEVANGSLWVDCSESGDRFSQWSANVGRAPEVSVSRTPFVRS
jgi:hypothetical protein